MGFTVISRIVKLHYCSK